MLHPGVKEYSRNHAAAVLFIKSDSGALRAENVTVDPVFTAEAVKEASAAKERYRVLTQGQ